MTHGIYTYVHVSLDSSWPVVNGKIIIIINATALAFLNSVLFDIYIFKRCYYIKNLLTSYIHKYSR